MSDTTETLVRMANQIATNLMHEPDPAAATAEHIRLYWDPRMKRGIMADSVTGLDLTVQQAIELLDELKA